MTTIRPTTNTRSINTFTIIARNTASHAAVRKDATQTTTCSAVSKDASVAPKTTLRKRNATTTAKPKRAAWDLRGRLLDTEAEIASYKTERERFNTQINT
ncbi:hypothetical protein Pmani_024100 [Petrolisthes manimaculis]|uniref:Uncharacterized protein n=1 Tax=Petrolisthes manimaculis TaxID=1843537 RepID=A0AAE1PAQ5_9EUCA|nr:hypothetical protein Pmani_024100 [Petrolisthes manimaculis]